MIIFTGCSSTVIIQEVPSFLKINKLYTAPKIVEAGGKEYDAEEGFIVVKENPDDSLSHKNMLPVFRIKSANKNTAEPIFWLNGGPGLSNMKYRLFPQLLENHDLVLVGYRGVDGSISLKSDEVEKALEGDGEDLLGVHSMNAISKAVDQFVDKLNSLGIDLSKYTITDVISDFEIARKAFGYKKINLLSLSYGTRVAIIYSYLHPDALFRSVQIGVNPPGHFSWDPKKVDVQLAYYDNLFASDSVFYDGRYLSSSIKKAFQNMPSRWTFFKLDPGKIRMIAFAMLYHKQSASLVFDCFRAAEKGDYSGLYLMQRMYDFMFPSMLVWGDLFAKGSTDFDVNSECGSSSKDSTTIIGAPLTQIICNAVIGHWPIHKISDELNRIQPSKVETLLISGSIDFSTPAEFAANELLPSLLKGKQVILKEMGHVDDILNLQRGALTNLLVRFYDEGVVDDSKFVYDRMNFDPPINLPLWSVILYPFVFILSFF